MDAQSLLHQSSAGSDYRSATSHLYKDGDGDGHDSHNQFQFIEDYAALSRMPHSVGDIAHFNGVTSIDKSESNMSLVLDDPAKNLDMTRRTPWVAFFTHPASLVLLQASWVFGWIGFSLLSELPSFLSDQLGFGLQSTGILCVAPYATLFIGAIGFGRFFDYLQHVRHWSVRSIRQVGALSLLVFLRIVLLIIFLRGF
jgi:hypothetical protein